MKILYQNYVCVPSTWEIIDCVFIYITPHDLPMDALNYNLKHYSRAS